MDDLEASRLHELEAIIDRGLRTFAEVGAALLEIRDHRLYQRSHKTFESYLRDRWDISRSYAHRTIEAAQVVAMLPDGNKPATEAVARELAPLKDDPEAMAETWASVNELHPEPTAPQVREAVRGNWQGQYARAKPETYEKRDEHVAAMNDYATLIAEAKTAPETRFRLGQKLTSEKLGGDYPPGRLKAIADEHGTTVKALREHVRFWETARRREIGLDFILRVSDYTDRRDDEFDWTERDLLAGIPADSRKQLRQVARQSIRTLEAYIEALR